MRFLRSTARFLNRHRFACALVILLVLFSFPSTASAVTHFQAQTCGSLVRGSGQDSDTQGTKQAALCFSLAHQQCHAATIDVQFLGIDTSSFTILSAANVLGGCALTVSIQSTGSCGSPLCLLKGLFPPDEVTCRRLSLQPTELNLQDCDHSNLNGPFLHWDS